MIDFHDHVLPGIDDGSRTMRETITLLQEAENAGFEKIICTPHFKESFYEADVAKREKLMDDVKREISKLNIKVELYLGNEIFMADDRIAELIKEKKASSIHNTRYVLFEFPLNSKPLNMFDMIYELQKNDKIPVLAHPERYFYLQREPEIIYDLINRGVMMQQNFASIIGHYGKKTKVMAEKMLKTNSVHFLGSDVHRKSTIYCKMDIILSRIERIIGKERLEMLTTVNPSLVLENKEIEFKNPDKIVWNWRDKFRMKF